MFTMGHIQLTIFDSRPVNYVPRMQQCNANPRLTVSKQAMNNQNRGQGVAVQRKNSETERRKKRL